LLLKFGSLGDNVAQTGGAVAGSLAKGVLPQQTTNASITTAGGALPAGAGSSPQSATDNLAQNASGSVVGGVGSNIVPSESKDTAIKAAGGTVPSQQ
jgi:hypothetical protein